MNEYGLHPKFFEVMEKSKTAKKMWQLFLSRGVDLQVIPGMGAYQDILPDGRRRIRLGKGSPVDLQVVYFCHEMVHALQPVVEVRMDTLKQIALCPTATSEFRGRQVATHMWREIAPYKMSNRILRELGMEEIPLEDWLYKFNVSGFRSSLHYYREGYSNERIRRYNDVQSETVYVIV